MVKQLESGEVNAEELKRNLEVAASLLEAVCIDETRCGHCPWHRGAARRAGGVTVPGSVPTSAPRRQMLDTEDELREMGSDAAVPSEVRDWLAATFTQQARAKGRRAEEKPKFRSIVHAVQAGIFVERWVRGWHRPTPWAVPGVEGAARPGMEIGSGQRGHPWGPGSRGLGPAARWVPKQPGGSLVPSPCPLQDVPPGIHHSRSQLLQLRPQLPEGTQGWWAAQYPPAGTLPQPGIA